MSELSLPLQELTTEELIRTESGLTVSVGKEIAPADRLYLWSMVKDGFVDLNRRSYEQQDMTYDEFAADLDSPHVLKYVARDTENAPIGLLTVHVGLDDITWTDTTRLRETQEAVDPNAAPYYVGTLVVPPSLRGSETASYLVKASFLHFKEVNQANNTNSLVFFDCAHANYPWLGEFVQKVGSPDEEYPDIQTHVTELYEEHYLRSSDGMAVIKSEQELDGYERLDSQHHYSIAIEAD